MDEWISRWVEMVCDILRVRVHGDEQGSVRKVRMKHMEVFYPDLFIMWVELFEFGAV